MSELDSLSLRANELSSKVDFWNNAVLLALLITFLAAGAIVISQRLAFVRAKQLGDMQERIASIKEADAKLVQEQIETTLATQQERAATAERKLLELQTRIKPRNLTEKQAADFASALRAIPGETIDFGYTSAGGDESFNFAKQFLPLFKKAGWIVRNETSIGNHLDVQVIGVGILVGVPAGPDPTKPPSGYIKLTPRLTALQSAFRAVGIEVQFISWFPGKDTPEIVIGSKPEPKPEPVPDLTGKKEHQAN